MGRPPIQHHKVVHTIALSPEVEEKIDTYLDLRKLKRVTETLRAFMASETGAGIVLGAIVTLVAYFGIRAATGPAENASRGFAKALMEAAGVPSQTADALWAEARAAVRNIPVIGEIAGALGF